MFDINSGLNTSDEIKIIDLVVNEVKKNNHGYIYFLINKCDDLSFNGEKPVFGDDELKELYDNSKKILQNKCSEIELNYSVHVICSSKLYIYRGVKNNISEIDENQLNTIIKTTCGTTELKKMKSLEQKRQFIQGLLKRKKEENIYDNWMEETGYHILKKKMETLISEKFTYIIFHHIVMELKKACEYFTRISYGTRDYNGDTNFILSYMVDQMNIFDSLYMNSLKYVKKNYPKNELEAQKKMVENELKQLNNIIKNFCEIKINILIEYTPTNIDFLDNTINMFLQYCQNLKKYFKDISTEYMFINEKRKKMITTQFVKKFDSELYREVKLFITNAELYKSITTLFETHDGNKNIISHYCDTYDIISNANHIVILNAVFYKYLNYIIELRHDIFKVKSIESNTTSWYLKYGNYFEECCVVNINDLENDVRINLFEKCLSIFKKCFPTKILINNVSIQPKPIEWNVDEKELLNIIILLYNILFIDFNSRNGFDVRDESVFLEWKNDKNNLCRKIIMQSFSVLFYLCPYK